MNTRHRPPSPRHRRPLAGLALAALLATALRAVPAQLPQQAGRPADPLPELRGESPAGDAVQVPLAAGDRLLVGLADRESRPRLGEWLKGLAGAADSAQFRRVVVVALPAMVPAPFRGAIRGAFPASGPITYLLDWGGGVVERIARERPLPCVLVIGPTPAVAASACGVADSARIASLVSVVRAQRPAAR